VHDIPTNASAKDIYLIISKLKLYFRVVLVRFRNVLVR